MSPPSPVAGLLSAAGWTALAVVMTPLVLPPMPLYRTVVAGTAVVLFVAAVVSPRVSWTLAALVATGSGVSSLVFGAWDSAPAGIIPLSAFLAGVALRGIYDIGPSLDPRYPTAPLLPLWRAVAAAACVSAAAAYVWERSSYLISFGVPPPRTVNVLGLDASEAIAGTATALAALLLAAGLHGAAARVSRDGAGRRILDAALTLAVLFPAGVAVLQRMGLLHVWRAERWAVWHRSQATFSDPSAAGVAAALLLPVVLARAATGPLAVRLAAGAGAAGLVAILADSGSRAGFLGAVTSVLLLGIWAVTRLAAGRRPGTRRRIVVTAGTLAIVSALAFSAAVAWPTRGASSSVLLSRLRASFSGGKSPAEGGMDRLLLYEVTIALFRDHPVAGAGLGVFRVEFPNIAVAKGQPVNFSDHPPSLYLGILAEMGLAGGLVSVLLLGGLLSGAGKALAFREERTEEALRAAGAGTAVIGLSVVFLFGSHLVYPEIAILVGILTARLQIPGESEGNRVLSAVLPVVLAGALVLLLGGVLARGLETWSAEFALGRAPSAGLFRVETEPGGRRFRWTSTAAVLRVETSRWEPVKLRFPVKNGRPDGAPVDVDVFWNDTRRGTVTLAPSGWKVLELEVGGSGVLRLVPSDTFRPRARSDGRRLGIQVGEWPTLAPAGPGASP